MSAWCVRSSCSALRSPYARVGGLVARRRAVRVLAGAAVVLGVLIALALG
jgi:hypothetical protein